jgi:16S rRNA (adenine1518-N6/adenine1519-N6)-dimethyltransferase
MVAEPGNKAYGRLSVMLQWRYYMENLFIVLPNAFDPPPKVESAIVRMIPIPLGSRLVCDEAKLQAVVSKAFSLRRKVIKNSLAGMFTEVQLEACGIDPSLRPEELSVEEYVSLANCL